ncbi:MAG: succinate dehydrogenase, hydrophobic membrane anchor protein [Rhizobiaceae bacterium]
MMQTPLGKVRGHGSAGEGTGTFWRQRLTAAANVPLMLFFTGIVISLAGASHEQVTETLARPVVNVLMILMVVSVSVHMRIGMKEIIEDYVHGPLLKVTLVIASTFFCAFTGAASVFALLKIAFGA